MHPLFLHIQAILWRFWKWLLHFLTGKCELYRLVAQATPVQTKARRVEQSLRNSRSQNLRSIVMSPSMDPSEATDIIVREKKIKTISSNDQFLEQLQPVLVRVRGVRLLWSEVEQLRAESYRQDNKEHEDMLLELWRYLQPNTPLESRITKQWQNIGFQGDNPATDFRGMGVLSLHCMLYFAEKYQSRARSVLSHSHHPQYDYPFAMVAIDLTGVAFKWLENGTLNYYHYTVATHWPLPLEQFMEIVCYLLVEFDKFWLSKEPENVMAFPRLRSEFVDQLSQKLKQDNITVLLQIHQ